MAKLSAQLQSSRTPIRATRSERVRESQRQQRSELQTQRFESAKAEAERIRAEQFGNLGSISEYEQKYNQLPSDIKQFFSTPAQLKETQAQRVTETKTKVDEKMASARAELEKLRTDYATERERIIHHPTWDSRTIKELRDDAKDEFDEDEKYYTRYITALNEGGGQLMSGKDLSFNDIDNYARSVGSWHRRNEALKNRGDRENEAQLKKITELEEKGYQAHLMQQFDPKTNKLIDEKITFYNKEEQKYADFQVPLGTKGKYVSGLTKSELGLTEIKRSIDIGGKSYDFQTVAQLYKTSDDKLTTQFTGKTNRTEDQIIRDIELKALKDLPDQRHDPYPEKTGITVKSVTSLTHPEDKWYEKSIQDYIQVGKKRIVYGFTHPDPKLKEGWKFVSDKFPDLYITKPNISLKALLPSLFGGGISLIGGLTTNPYNLQGEPNLKIGEGMENTRTGIGAWIDKRETQVYGENPYLEIEEIVQKESQERFEDMYMPSIIKGDLTFEEAVKQYEESNTAKQMNKKYGKMIQDEQRAILLDQKYGATKLVLFGLEKTAYSTLQLATYLVPTNVGELALYSGAGYGIVKGAGAVTSTVPKYVQNIIVGTFGVAGVSKAISPLSSVEEVGAGVLQAGLSFGILGYSGYKYLKQPVRSFMEIKSPVRSIKSHQVVGQDLKILKNELKANKVLFGKSRIYKHLADDGSIFYKTGSSQKVYQEVIMRKMHIGKWGSTKLKLVAGRRSVVTTKWRSIFNDYLGFKLKNVYEGIPTMQKGQVWNMNSFRSTFDLGKTKSGYQKATDLLTKRGGYTPYQAKTLLQYHPVRVVQGIVEEGELLIKGSKAVGTFVHLTKQPVITIDGKLGIKTRGARTIKDAIHVRRQLVQLKSGGVIAVEEKWGGSIFLKRGSSTIGDFRGFIPHEVGFTGSKVSGIKKGYEPLSNYGKTVKSHTMVNYKDLTTASVHKPTFPSKNVIKITTHQRTRLIDKIIDLDKATSTKYFNPARKTAWSKTFGAGDDIIDKVDDFVVPRASKEVENIIKEINSAKNTGFKFDSGTKYTPFSKPQSNYWGTGQYERTAGGQAVQQQYSLKHDLGIPSANLQQQLQMNMKSAINFDNPSVSAVKDAILIKQLNNFATSDKALLSLGAVEVLKSNAGLKSDFGLKTNFKMDVDLKTDLGLKSDLKTDVALKSQLKTLLKQPNLKVGISGLAPSFKTPTLPKPKVPKTPIIPVWLPSGKISQKKKKDKDGIQQFAFLPDFTSRSIGLEPEMISQAQAKAKLKKILTGLEIRRGVKLQ